MSEEVKDQGVYERLATVQAEIGAVEKDGKANYGKYTTLDKLNAHLRPLLGKVKACVIDKVIDVEGQLQMETSFVCETGEVKITSPFPYKDALRGNNEIQKIGSGLTYMRRYNRYCLFNISSEEDDDGQSMKDVKPDRIKHKGVTNKAQKKPLSNDPMNTLNNMKYVIQSGSYQGQMIQDIDPVDLDKSLKKAISFCETKGKEIPDEIIFIDTVNKGRLKDVSE